MAEKTPFTVSIRFLKSLAHHLFGDSPAAVLRELVQNAHDAILMRASGVDANRLGNWAVHVIVDEPRHQITILDDGIGMNAQDVVKSLTRLGYGKDPDSMKVLLEKARNPEMLADVIGRFGVGFIATMIISTRVEVYSRKEECPAVFCVFDEGEEEVTYETRPVPGMTPESGTRIVLHVDPQRAVIRDDLIWNTKGGSLLNQEIAERILVKYCDLLKFDVMLGPDPDNLKVVNAKSAPWERGTRPSKQEMLTYFKRRFGEGLNEPIDFLVFELTAAVHKIDAAGVLYVPRPSQRDADKANHETLEVFINRMWVCDTAFDVMPEWARFFRGVIVSSSLASSMNRTGLDHLDKSYGELQIALRECLRRYFVELAQRNADTFRDILDHHGHELRLGLASERNKYDGACPIWFADLIRILPFRVYSRKYPAGYEASLNELLGIAPTAALVKKENGQRHELHGVSRIVLPNQQTEFRKVLTDKTYPIIVPENGIDLAFLGAIGHSFEDVLTISNVEFRFSNDFVQPLEPAEQDRWRMFQEFVSSDMLRYKEKATEMMGEVRVGRIPKNDLPMLIHWKDTKPNDPEMPGRNMDRARHKQITTINASNQFMKGLLEYVERRDIRRIETASLIGNSLYVSYYLAILEQSANMPTQQFQDLVSWTMETLKRGQDTAVELDDVKKKAEDLEQENRKLADDIARLQAPSRPGGVLIPDKPEPRTAAIVFVDLIRSTQVLGALDFADRPEVFARYASMLRVEIEKKGGFFDKFTGDGIIALFGVEGENTPPGDVCRRAVEFAQLARVLTMSFGDDANVRPALHELVAGQSGQGLFTCRVAISCGQVGFGRVAGQASAVGTKMVEAARVCSEAELYGETGAIVVTADVYGALGAPTKGYEMVKKDFQPRGLLHTTNLYKVG